MPILAVAPHWGAWIEIASRKARPARNAVAPHWGAWIEMRLPGRANGSGTGSHPTGVRGLKSRKTGRGETPAHVAPHWGAWIEIASKSKPATTSTRRTPLGCVD